MFQGLKNQYCANIGVASSGIVWRQAVATKLEESWITLRLTVRVFPPGDVCKVKGFKGAWCLAARGVRQAVWKRVSPGSSEAAPGDNVEVDNLLFWRTWFIRLWWYLKGRLVGCLLSCSSKRIPWVVARDQG